MKRCATFLMVLAGWTTAAEPANGRVRSAPAPAVSPAGPLAPASATRHRVRLAPGVRPAAGRRERRRSLVSFAHLTDLHVTDEASPARHEALQGMHPAFAGFWRPHESFGAHVADQAVRAVNRHATSRIAGAGGPAPLEFALVTGDLADNAQSNEVRWAVRALDGGRLDPFSGQRVSARNRCRAPAAVVRRLDRAVALRRYAGVGGGRPALASLAERWPGALQRAQRPFTAEGLAIPWYSVRGNHDALAQGHYGPQVAQPRSAPTGCRKAFPTGGRTSPVALADTWAELRRRLPTARFVPPDTRRRFLRSPGEFRRLHGGDDHAHGFAFTPPAERRRSAGSALYYAWSPRPDLRFVALDTAVDAGGAGGNLDHPQYLWLARELQRASRRGQLVVVYAHHPLEMMSNRASDEAAGRFDPDPRDSRPVHLGRTGPASLRALLLRHPNVVLFLAGHKHYDRVWGNFRRDGRGFWQVITSALAGAPQEVRLLELMDNRDGSLSLFTTMLPHAAPRDPGSDMGPAALASIARVLAQGRRAGPPRRPGAGGPMRNVELVLSDPTRWGARTSPR